MSLQQKMKDFLSCDPSGMVWKVRSSSTFGLKGQESNHDYGWQITSFVKADASKLIS